MNTASIIVNLLISFKTFLFFLENYACKHSFSESFFSYFNIGQSLCNFFSRGIAMLFSIQMVCTYRNATLFIRLSPVLLIHLGEDFIYCTVLYTYRKLGYLYCGVLHFNWNFLVFLLIKLTKKNTHTHTHFYKPLQTVQFQISVAEIIPVRFIICTISWG